MKVKELIEEIKNYQDYDIQTVVFENDIHGNEITYKLENVELILESQKLIVLEFKEIKNIG